MDDSIFVGRDLGDMPMLDKSGILIISEPDTVQSSKLVERW